MTRLLIVDDENHLIESMLSSIPWETAGVTEVVGAYSAFEALDRLEEQEFDIVITDVKMPEMNGLELTALIKQRYKHMKCVLLSGYAEFELVKAGMRNEASDYLLKPVRDDVLLARIRELAGELRREKEQDRAYVASTAFFHQSLPILKAKLLSDVVLGSSGTQRQLLEQLQRYEISMQLGEHISLIVIRIEPEKNMSERIDMKLMSFAVTNIMEELVQEHYDCWFGEDINGLLMVVVRPKEPVQEAQPLAHICDQLLRIVRRLYKYTVSAIIAEQVLFPEGVQQAYQQCVTSIRQLLSEDGDMIITVGAESRPIAPSVLNSLYQLPLFGHLLESGQWGEAHLKLEEIVREWREQFSGSQEHLMEIYYSLSASFLFLIHKNGKRITDYRMASGHLIKTIEELQGWASDLINGLQTETQDDLSHHRQSLVEQVQQYIQANLASDLSLQAIATHVHLHPVYLSKVYKKETGENIANQVLRLRMESALYWLNHKELKVYEVAEKVGYNNPAYFIRVFKSHFKMTPQEYRGEPPKG